MNARTRLYTAINGDVPDRVPVVPKIWVDLGARLTGRDLLEVVQDPFTALEVIAQAGKLCNVDAVRQFHFPARRTAEKEGRVFEVEPILWSIVFQRRPASPFPVKNCMSSWAAASGSAKSWRKEQPKPWRRASSTSTSD